jgi:hypothetical protein
MNSSFSSETDYFSGVFENRLSKILSLSFSLSMSFFLVIPDCCIIWMCQNENRKTMLTKLFTSAWILVLFWFCGVQV